MQEIFRNTYSPTIHKLFTKLVAERKSVLVKTVGQASRVYGVRRQAKRDTALGERLVLRWIRDNTSQSGVALRLPPHSIWLWPTVLIARTLPAIRLDKARGNGLLIAAYDVDHGGGAFFLSERIDCGDALPGCGRHEALTQDSLDGDA